MWGMPGITTLMELSQGTSVWGSGGQPTNIPIARGDILRNLLVQTTGAQTSTVGTGTIAKDPRGPYNEYSLITLGPSNSAKIVNLSGYGNYLASLMKLKERFGYGSLDAAVPTVQDPATFTDVITYATATGTFNNTMPIPVCQMIRSMGHEVGLWQLSEQTMNMVLALTINSASGSSPYNIFSTTASASPFLVTGNATVTLGSPTIDVLRILYKNPKNPDDYPPFDWVSVWAEDTLTNVVSKAPSYTFPANSGLLCRAAVNFFDATAGDGALVQTYFTPANAIQLLYGTSESKIVESGVERQGKNAYDMGFLPPKGVFFFDFFGQDLTLADVLNTATLLNIRLNFALSTALPANSTGVVDYQLLQPIVG